MLLLLREFSHSTMEVKLRAIWLLLDDTCSDGTGAAYWEMIMVVFVPGDYGFDVFLEAVI